jgi:isovaleryl-CoA dehydrogenase
MTDSDAPPGTGNVAKVFSGLSADEQEILDQADRFARRDLYPLAQRMDDEEWPPRRFLPAHGVLHRQGACSSD